ncbi:MAG: Smr/MutS family protein [Alphaproteobacteria bacterium]|nr:Smr/MutS family protein [Alphaproteobacteria bacterium]
MKKGRNSAGKDEEGRRLWQGVTRSVKAYAPAKDPSPKAAAAPAKTHPVTKTPAEPAAPSPSSRGFDRSTATKLKRGQLPLEGRLDLHGMTQQEAFDALQGFLRAAAAHQKRTVLVITGKGQRSEGVLRRLLPLWLEEPSLKKYILAVTGAAAKDGGSGAFYIRLRKPKN